MQVNETFPIVALLFRGLQVLYAVAADALEIPTKVPANTRIAIESAETFFDTLTSTKFHKSHKSMWHQYGNPIFGDAIFRGEKLCLSVKLL